MQPRVGRIDDRGLRIHGNHDGQRRSEPRIFFGGVLRIVYQGLYSSSLLQETTAFHRSVFRHIQVAIPIVNGFLHEIQIRHKGLPDQRRIHRVGEVHSFQISLTISRAVRGLVVERKTRIGRFVRVVPFLPRAEPRVGEILGCPGEKMYWGEENGKGGDV